MDYPAHPSVVSFCTLPNGEYGNDQAVKVEEIQSINR
ncbi:hypothetical protein KY5_4643c [Streptomyces formicae]|uniref:Uncharacterized protein n=1 Tax=Streptomyces formicae TaxID=1616117 RepID=A0A291QD87_9ACTN|nr:hypothetical protein KY5_4643c [Streptomyces formicae]